MANWLAEKSNITYEGKIEEKGNYLSKLKN